MILTMKTNEIFIFRLSAEERRYCSDFNIPLLQAIYGNSHGACFWCFVFYFGRLSTYR